MRCGRCCGRRGAIGRPGAGWSVARRPTRARSLDAHPAGSPSTSLRRRTPRWSSAGISKREGSDQFVAASALRSRAVASFVGGRHRVVLPPEGDETESVNGRRTAAVHARGRFEARHAQHQPSQLTLRSQTRRISNCSLITLAPAARGRRNSGTGTGWCPSARTSLGSRRAWMAESCPTANAPDLRPHGHVVRTPSAQQSPVFVVAATVPGHEISDHRTPRQSRLQFPGGAVAPSWIWHPSPSSSRRAKGRRYISVRAPGRADDLALRS